MFQTELNELEVISDEYTTPYILRLDVYDQILNVDARNLF